MKLHLPPKLPQTGTTIFTEMTALAMAHGAVNLGQGFPDFDGSPALMAEVTRAMQNGHNQYPPMAGVLALRVAISAKVADAGGNYHPDTEVTITAGATQAILTALLALVHPGDEVIVLEPAYDSYAPGIALAGGRMVAVPLTPTHRPDFDAVARAITPRTRAIIINTPHNPSATVWTRAEMQALSDLLAPTNIVVIADEVYEHMVYDGAAHVSAAALPGLSERSLVISSFGKTFHVTGWKVGYVCAPAELTAAFRRVHQFNVFTVNTPMQHGLAAYLRATTDHLQLSDFYQAKRDVFLDGLRQLPWQCLPCEGTYFQCVDYSAWDHDMAQLDDLSLAKWLTIHHGVATIPLSPFSSSPNNGLKRLRFCFAKQASTLEAALERLGRIN